MSSLSSKVILSPLISRAASWNFASSFSAFYYLLKKIEPDYVFDLGSRDGTDSLRFRRLLPNASLVAVEANPVLAAKMQTNPQIIDAKVDVKNAAVSNLTGTSNFSVCESEMDLGNGSLLHRDSLTSEHTFEVQTLTIANLLSGIDSTKVALWIDVEGCGYEVIEGLKGHEQKVAVIHIEVESKEHWKGQKLYPEVKQLLETMGFFPYNVSFCDEVGQGNVVFLRKDLSLRLPGLLAETVRMSAGNFAANRKWDAEFPRLFALAQKCMPHLKANI